MLMEEEDVQMLPRCGRRKRGIVGIRGGIFRMFNAKVYVTYDCCGVAEMKLSEMFVFYGDLLRHQHQKSGKSFGNLSAKNNKGIRKTFSHTSRCPSEERVLPINSRPEDPSNHILHISKFKRVLGVICG